MSLSILVALTMITHYVVTQIPNGLEENIDTSTPPTDVNAFDSRGTTPLMQAAIDSDYERAKILIAQGADVNARSASVDQDYPLNYALVNGGKLGSLDVAKLLIANGADVNAANARKMTSMHTVMFVNNLEDRWEIFKDLMDHGAHINAQAEDGSTMMHISVTLWNDDWIKQLNSEYAQIINYGLKDNKGRTPWDLATERGTVSYIAGTQSVQEAIRIRPPYIGDDFNVTATDNYGRNGLMLAVLRSDMKFVDALVNRGTNLAAQDKKGNTALHYAVVTLDPQTYVSYLLEHKAPTNIANANGETPLFFVMKIFDLPTRHALAQLLIAAGSPVTNKNSAGKTITDLAVAARDKKLVEMIRQQIEKRATSTKDTLGKDVKK
jgi:ankyrin repeat protein